MKKAYRRNITKKGEEKVRTQGPFLDDEEDIPIYDFGDRFVSRSAIFTAGPSTEGNDNDASQNNNINNSKQDILNQRDRESNKFNNSQANTNVSPRVQSQEGGMAGGQENHVKRKPVASPNRGTPYGRLHKNGRNQGGERKKELEEPDDTSPLTAVRLTTEYGGGDRSATGYNESPLNGKVFRLLGAFKKDELTLDEWITLNGGVVVDEDEQDKARFVILGDGVKRFDILNAIAREYILVTREAVEESFISGVNTVDLDDMPPITSEDMEYLNIPQTQSLVGVTVGVFGCTTSTSHALHQVIEECGGDVEDTLSTEMDLILLRKAPTKILAEGIKRFGIARIDYEDLAKLVNEETTVKMLFRKAKDSTERGRAKSPGAKQGRYKSPRGSIMDAFARGQNKALGGGTHGESKEDSKNTIGRGRSKSIERGNRGQDRRSSGSVSSGGKQQGPSNQSEVEKGDREQGAKLSEYADGAPMRGRGTSPGSGIQDHGQKSSAYRSSKDSKSSSVSFNLQSPGQHTPSSRSITNVSSVTDDISPMHNARLKPKRPIEQVTVATPPGVQVLPVESMREGRGPSSRYKAPPTNSRQQVRPIATGISHNEITIVLVEIKILQPEDPAKVIPKLLLEATKILHGEDETARLVHLTTDSLQFGSNKNNNTKGTQANLTNLNDIYNNWVYFNGTPPQKLKPMGRNAKPDRFRTFNASARIGSNKDLTEIVANTQLLWGNMVDDVGKITISIKPLQAVKTVQSHVLVAVPTSANKENLATVLTKYMEETFDKMRSKNQLPAGHADRRAVPEINLVTNYFQHLPYDPESFNDDTIPWYIERPIHIEVRVEDVQLLEAILQKMKSKHILEEAIGGGSYTFMNINRSPSIDEVNLIKEVKHYHNSSLLETRAINLQGLTHPDSPVIVRQYGYNTDGTAYVKKAHTLTIRRIFSRIKFNGVRPFSLLAATDNGYVINHMSGPRHTWMERALQEVGGCPSGYIKFWLMKRDLDNDDIFKLLKASFTRAEVVAALEAEYVEGQVVSRRRSVANGDKAKYESFRNNQYSGELRRETGMGRAEREKYEKEEAEKQLKEMENEAALFDDTNNNDDATATTRGRTTLGSSVFLAEEDWDSEDDDLSEYESEDDDYNIDISRVQLDQVYEKSSTKDMTEYSDTEDPRPPHQRATEETELGQDEDYEKDTRMEKQGRDEEAAEAQANTIHDSDGWSTNRQTTVDDVLANRRLHVFPDEMTGEEDKMDYEITPDQSEKVQDQSEKMQEKAVAILDKQLQDFDYGPSHYERAKIAQNYISSQSTVRRITDGGITQETSTGSPSTHIENTPDQSEQVQDQSENVQEKAAATPYNNQYHDFEYGPSQYEHAQIRATNLQYFISNQRTMRQISDGGVTQGGPSSNILLLTDGNPPGHDGTEVQQNHPPQQLTIYETSAGLIGEAGTCVTQSTTTELTQVTQGEEERELNSENEQSIGPIGSLPEHISDRGDSNEGPGDIALRIAPDTRSQVAAGRLPQGSAESPSNHILLSILGSGVGRPGGPPAPVQQSSLQRHTKSQLGTGLGGETSTGGESSTTATIQETQPAVEASSHRTQPKRTLVKKVQKGKKGPQNE